MILVLGISGALSAGFLVRKRPPGRFWDRA
jgi:hypothetical protein